MIKEENIVALPIPAMREWVGNYDVNIEAIARELKTIRRV